MDIFAPPLIGPFVERNKLSEGVHIGASVKWTSNGEAYLLDLIRLPAQSIWSDTLGFAQTQEFDLDQFLWHCFESNTRLPEFLNELQPFFRPSHGAPTPANAGKWLNPALVEKGFSLGTPTVRNGNFVRVPVVWAFGGNVACYGSRTVYARVDFIDWFPSKCTLLRRYDCWGTGAYALKRLLHRLAGTINGPLLTKAGESRMRQAFAGHPKGTPARKNRRSLVTDRVAAQALRKVLDKLPNVLTPAQAGQIDQLSDSAYVGLLRTCARRGLERTACTLVTHRRLPELGRENLLRHFIDAKWKKIWDSCAKEIHQQFTSSKYGGYNELLSRVLKSGDAELLRTVLDSLPKIGLHLVCFLVETALENGRHDLVEVIIASRVVLPIRDKCLLECFTHFLFSHRRSCDAALYLLELGVRPIQAMDDDDVLGPKTWLLETENLPILKRAFELETPTEESVTKLLNGFHVKRGETFDWLCTVSRGLPGHKHRIEHVAFHATVLFIRGGSRDAVELLDQVLKEGVNLKDITWSRFEDAKLLEGYRWRDQEGHWIDLIAYLIRIGRKCDAEILKKLKRPSKQRRKSITSR